MNLNMIKQLERHARSDPSIISLGQGIPASPAAKAIRSEVIRALKEVDDIDRYSDPAGISPLRNRIASLLQKSDMNYASDEIIVTADAIEAINATLQTFVTSDKNEVIVPMPTYSAYARAIECAKGKAVPVLLNEKQGWRLDIAKIESAISDKTAAILLCNPNNPTGNLYDKRTLIALCRLAKKHGFLLILDEVYGNMVFDNNTLYSPCTDSTFKQNVVRIVSFSKDFNLTGWRIGFLHGSREIVGQITPVHDTLINCAPVVSQYAAVAAIDAFDEIVEQNRKSYTQRRDAMQHYLDDMSEWLVYTPVQGGYFFFPKLLLDVSSDQFCYDLLKKSKVIAIPGSDFGVGGERHIRLCFGRSTQDIHEGMQRLQAYLKSQYPARSKATLVTQLARE